WLEGLARYLRVAESEDHRALSDARLFPEGFALRDEANAIVAMAFRNGPIEDLHAGKSSGLLSNPESSRITDDEMKTLMINASEQVAKLLELKETDPEEYYRQMLSCNHMYCRRWER
ncbi:MAG: hypothetical protein HQ581_01045, partial [Planctomycetes bacterium]|nr:hypothetical protein [Planctomycetota bacterium]